jgi:phosphoglycerate dehydrogenase-like enzyme
MNVLIDLPVHDEALARLRALPGVNVTIAPPNEGESFRELPVELIAGTEVLLSSIPPTNHAAMKGLKVLQLGCAGFEHIIPLNMPARGVTVCNGAGIFDTPIAEWNVMMMIALGRRMVEMIDHQRAAVWDRAPRFQHELRHSTVGFWGYGGLARATARLCKAMGMTVHALTRGGVKPRLDKYAEPGSGDPEGVFVDRDFSHEQRQEFLRGLDFLIIATPLTPATRGMVGEAELRALKPGAYLLNPARGPLIQEQPLLRALREKWFAGAALDTHYAYPLPPEHPLWKMPNVILTPHISGSDGSPFYIQRVWRIFLENMNRYREGRPMLNLLSPQALTPA